MVCVGVVACNHLILSLREAGGRPLSVAPLSYSVSQHTTNDASAFQSSDITNTHPNGSNPIQLPQHSVSTDSDHKEINLTRKPGTWHEMRPVRVSTTRVSLEMA